MRNSIKVASVANVTRSIPRCHARYRRFTAVYRSCTAVHDALVRNRGEEREMNPWMDLAVVGAVFAGIFLTGLYGDVVVGWMIYGVAAVVEAVASGAARALRSLRPTPQRQSPEPAGRHAASPAGRLP
jgi:hypothetical protein